MNQLKVSKSGPIAFAIGLTAGSVGSLIGLGGSFIALPMLTGVLKMQQHMAHGTGLVTVLCTAIGGTVAYSQSNRGERKNELQRSFLSNGFPAKIGNVDAIVAISLAAASSMTVAKGAAISKSLSPFALKLSMGCVQFAVGPLIPLRSYLKDKFSNPTTKTSAISSISDSSYLRSAKSFLIGGCAGLLAGIFGVGGGALQVPALCLFTDIDYHTALGTSMAAMIPVAVVGSIAHYRQNTLDPRVAIPLGMGSFIGSFIGGTKAKSIDTTELQYVFPAVMMSLGVHAIIQSLRMVR